MTIFFIARFRFPPKFQLNGDNKTDWVAFWGVLNAWSIRRMCMDQNLTKPENCANFSSPELEI